MQWPAGAGVPQHARLRRPHLDQGCDLPRCPTRPGSFSAPSSHWHHSSGWTGRNTHSGVLVTALCDHSTFD